MIVSNSYSLSNFNSNFQKNCAILVVYGLCGYDILFLVYLCACHFLYNLTSSIFVCPLSVCRIRK